MHEMKFIRDISERFNGTAHLYRYDNEQYIVVSHVDDGTYCLAETLAFLSTKDGEPYDWLDVAGGPGMSIEQVVHSLRMEGVHEWGT